MRRKRSAWQAAALAALCTWVWSGGAGARVTPFGQDVNAAIDDGLQWFIDNDVFGPRAGSRTCIISHGSDWVIGLPLLALLEKRASADFDAPIQGYSGASAAHQQAMRDAVDYILGRFMGRGFYAYGTGATLMALTVYARTGGPEIPGRVSLDDAIRAFTNRTLVAGRTAFWGYTGPGNDSSTTQFAVAGLAAARAYFLDPAYGNDPALAAQIDALLATTAGHYERNRRSSGDGFGGQGHGYRIGNGPSYQQTASGLWCQLLGGSTLQNVGAAAYMRWLVDRYNYQSTRHAWQSWPQAFYYYLWSSSKAYTLIENAGMAPAADGAHPDVLGTLPPVGPRLAHRDPTVDPRPARRGPGGPGYYADEEPRWYYDYAYTLMTHQNADGYFVNPQGSWNRCADQAYAILVLERSLGGACLDSDDDEICDDEDNCPEQPNADQADADGDGYGDVCDECPNQAPGDDPDPERPGCPNNQPPVAVCQDLVLEAGPQCTACGSVDGGSYDPDGDALDISQAPACDYGLGDTDVVLTVSDGQFDDQCAATVTVVDVTAPTIDCNAPETITPPDAPICFTPTAADNCSVDSAITGYDCWMINGADKRVDKRQSCVVEIRDGSVCIIDSGGVGDNIDWTVSATDGSGNTTEVTCSVSVVRPGGGGNGGGNGGGGSGCNQGIGNGDEGCDPGNSNQGDPANSNDEPGGTGRGRGR